MRIALVHDWLTGLRGGERVLDVLARAHPDAELYTLIHRPGATTPAIDALRVHTSPLDRLPGVERYYRKLLPLYPWAIDRLRPHDCDLVLSISHAVAKSVPVPAGTPHLCYCLTPMRYVWDQADAYLGRGLRRAAATPLVSALRRFDRSRSTPAHVTRFVAISRGVSERIRRHYARPSRVVHPPVDVERFQPTGARPDDYYLLVGAFVPYKREDLAIEAFRRSGRRLVVAGDGPLRGRIEASAPPNVEFVGRVPDDTLAELFAGCRALVHPQHEDFGLVAVEVQAAGRPVIALAAGGALDTVRPLHDTPHEGAEAPTGVLFEQQSAEALAAAVERFERSEHVFDAKAIRRHAEHFGPRRFAEALGREIEAARAGRDQ